MEDLTKGSIPKHIVRMAMPIAIGMFVQTCYLLIDLYFVGRLGEQSLGGVSAAANLSMFILALTQMLNVSTGTLIAHAVGRKDRKDANSVFNQSLMVSMAMVLVTLVLGYSCAHTYMNILSSDTQVRTEGTTYLYYVIPSLALQFSLVAMSAAMRGTGIVKPAMQVQMLSLVVNIILTPILIEGWITGYPMGVAGAGLSSSISMIFAVVVLWRYFEKFTQYVSVDFSQWIPKQTTIRKLLKIGFPAGAEFLLIFINAAFVYWAIQGFGSNATAAFGLGTRVLQAMMLPAMAVAFALPAVVGQNVGASLPQRVKQSFRWSLGMSSALMCMVMVCCFFSAEYVVTFFTNDTEVALIAETYLTIICLNFVPSGIIFSCTGLFQGIGNTWPGLLSSSLRLVAFIIPLVWLTSQPNFHIEQVWYLSAATVLVQMTLNLYLAKGQLRKIGV
ncbi:MATE family efflux transporter [Alteromonas sp. KUL49]|uniref:MATE family efflux transporter n=1 Tax=Alteromonas sp. KUL49 TaxID=2480798 RepID=UPI00102F0546|nr:MATE family efflux transporter [Alteromonas sp. KUL49]TAP40798.1 MATE family efflux transporter [Alteromonas sp. KUL49]GEA10974.1 MATE family efflux transporter [Alteromonas sp. KUL49]